MPVKWRTLMGTSLLCATLCGCLLQEKPQDMAPAPPGPDGMEGGVPAPDLSMQDAALPDLAMPDLYRPPPMWMKLVPVNSPPGRSRHRMAFDSSRGKVVLFGGLVQPSPPNYFATDETWEWDGTTWESKTPVHQPPARDSFGMTFDSKANRTIVFGGYTDPGGQNLDDTWSWDGMDWTRAMGSTKPPARETMMGDGPCCSAVTRVV